ncbi:MAG: hypothetical protein IID46_11555 [Planctomycetes bacterium]|nr:hypothetical protein [Planctomycetota bacterium]
MDQHSLDDRNITGRDEAGASYNRTPAVIEDALIEEIRDLLRSNGMAGSLRNLAGNLADGELLHGFVSAW